VKKLACVTALTFGLVACNGEKAPENNLAADASGKALQTIIRTLRRQGYVVSTHEASAKPPRGYDADHPRIDLLKMKDIHAGRLFEPAAWLSTPKAAGRVAKAMKDLEPFNAWIKKQVGR